VKKVLIAGPLVAKKVLLVNALVCEESSINGSTSFKKELLAGQLVCG